MVSRELRLADPDLPGLEFALDGAAVTRELEPVLGAGWRTVAADIVKHKAGRRCSIAYVLERGGERMRLFAKTFRNDRGANVFEKMRRLAAHVGGGDLVVPRPIAYLPGPQLLVTEYLDGVPLAPALYRGGDPEPARQAGAALAALHRSGTAFAQRWRVARELENTARWLDGLAATRPGLLPEARALHARLAQRAAELPGGPERPIHRDYYAEQLAVTAAGVAILDLDDARSGDPAVDVGNFLAHLELRAVQFEETAPGCATARPELLSSYRAGVGADEEILRGLDERVAFYEASAYLRLAGVYGQRERWAERIPPAMLDRCSRRIAP